MLVFLLVPFPIGHLVGGPSWWILAKQVMQDLCDLIQLWNGLLWYPKKISFMSTRVGFKTICYKSAMMAPLQGTLVENTLHHSWKWAIIWRMKPRSASILTWHAKISLPKKCKILVAISYFEGPWESVSMDFMLNLPFSNGFDTNMVVYWFSKMAHFIPIPNILIA